MAKYKVLVTGSTGALGKDLVLEFLKYENFEVHALVRSHKKVPLKWQKTGIKIIEGDVRNLDAPKIQESLREVDTIIHAAALTKESEGKKRLFETNTDATVRLFQKALEYGVLKKFIFISSLAVFGEGSGSYEEKEEVAQSKLITKYGLSKCEAEKHLRSIANRSHKKVQLVIIRPSIIYGAGSSWTVEPLRILRKGIPIAPSPKHSSYGHFVYVNDVSRLIVQVATSTDVEDKIFHIIGSRIPWYQFIHYYSQIVGKDLKFIPLRLLKFATIFLKEARILHSLLTGNRIYEENNLKKIGFKYVWNIYEGMEALRKELLEEKEEYFSQTPHKNLYIVTPTGNFIYPKRIWYANSEEEVRGAIVACRSRNWKLRVRGGLYSFSNLCETGEVILDTRPLNKIVSIDDNLVTVQAGISLGVLVRELAKQGFELEYSGAMKAQTVAGAISTGNHGCMVSTGSLANLVEKFRLVDGQGLTKVFIRGEEEFLDSLIGIGALGAITEVSLRIRPLVPYVERKEYLSLVDINRKFWEIVKPVDHWFALLFPKLDVVVLTSYERSTKARIKNPKEHRPAVSKLEIYILKYVLRCFSPIRSRFLYPMLCYPAHFLMRYFKKPIEGYLYGFFVADAEDETNHYPLYDVEFSIPQHSLEEALKEVITWFSPKMFKKHPELKEFSRWGFPRLHIRPQAKEKIPLSGSFSDDICWIEFWVDKRMPLEDFIVFQKFIHSRLFKFNYRIHFGKNMVIVPEYIKQIYKELPEVAKLSLKYDPDRVFSSKFTESLFQV